MASKKQPHPAPPGKVKIAAALKTLLKEKDFNSIRTVDISRTAGVNEALIYRYYKDKRGLLHAVLAEYLEEYIEKIILNIKEIQGTPQKLRKLIRDTLHFYQQDRVFSKILLLEARNFSGYFESETYQMVRKYSEFVLELINEGIKNGELRDDIAPTHIRQIILGGIEHLCLPGVIYQYDIAPDQLTDDVCAIIFGGIMSRSD